MRVGAKILRVWSCGKLEGLPQVGGRAPVQHARISVDMLGKASGLPQVGGSVPTDIRCFKNMLTQHLHKHYTPGALPSQHHNSALRTNCDKVPVMVDIV